MKKKIYFLSHREEKYNEINAMFDLPEYELVWEPADIPELQTEDEDFLIKKKVLDAFKKIKRPVLVEHTALEIEAFRKLPGLQTRNFYAKIGCQNIMDFCEMKKEYKATAKSILGFCDGRHVARATGIDPGTILHSGKAIPDGFDWDQIFVPSENNPDGKTYAEMGAEKNKRSMRKLAWDQMRPEIEKADQSLFSVDDSKELEELAKLIREKKVLLFVGAGISASVGLPAWKDLINELGSKKGIDEELFESYGNYMLLAEYADDDGTGTGVYEHIRNKFDIKGNEEIRQELCGSAIYKILYELDFPVIYTTNFDHLIEDYYGEQGKSCSVVTLIADMEKLDSGTTRIMKFHGDIDKENSIVFSESQYFERMDFQYFMDIQLQADLLQYSVLFLGYSLSDINIKLLLYLAQKRWKAAGGGTAKNSYIFTATPNYVQKEVFKRNGIISLSGDIVDKKKGTLEFLRRLKECVKGGGMS